MSLEEFMRTHRTPGWKPEPLPKASKSLPRTSGKSLAELLTRFNVTGFGTERAARTPAPAGETLEAFMRRKSDVRFVVKPLVPKGVTLRKMSERAFREALDSYNRTYGKVGA